jgi:hypothetical protein
MEECPICLEDLAERTVSTLGCCRKMMHFECLINCLKMKLECPMCRAVHESINMVQNTERVFVAVPVMNKKMFRDALLCTMATSIVAISVSGTWCY